LAILLQPAKKPARDGSAGGRLNTWIVTTDHRTAHQPSSQLDTVAHDTVIVAIVWHAMTPITQGTPMTGSESTEVHVLGSSVKTAAGVGVRILLLVGVAALLVACTQPRISTNDAAQFRQIVTESKTVREKILVDCANTIEARSSREERVAAARILLAKSQTVPRATCEYLMDAWIAGQISDDAFARMASGRATAADNAAVAAVIVARPDETAEATAGERPMSLAERIKEDLKMEAKKEVSTQSQGPAIPRYDVESHCDTISRVAGNKSQRIFNTCIDQEQQTYNGLRAKWLTFPSDAQGHCDTIARVGGAGSYRLLATCLQNEMEAAGSARRFKP
jgi:hypothetical protein